MSRRWYTNEDWSTDIEKAFFARLEKSCGKAQYLKIQASVLRISHPTITLILLERYFALGDTSFHSQAYEIQAASLEELGDIDGARNALESAILHMEKAPQWGGGAKLSLPTLIAKHRLKQHYSRAFQLLNEIQGAAIFPAQNYEWHGARAILLFEAEQPIKACAEALLALECESMVDSGISRHKDVGLVTPVEDEFRRRLIRIATKFH
jgi:hypothetical protein